MAEAAVEQRPNRFFCHQCSVLIDPTLPDYTCPRCQSGFIEMLETEDRPADNVPTPDMDPALRFEELWGRTFMDSLTEHRDQVQHRHGGPSAPGDNADLDNDVPMAADGEPDDPMGMHRHPFRHGRIVFRRTGPAGLAGAGPRTGRHQAIENIVQQLLTSLTSGAMFGRTGTIPLGTMFNLYGNPGDYAWGASGLDSIITQLLNQLDGTGPPPAPKDKIDTLPETKITQEQVDKTLQCSVCMEDFAVDEMVRRLPCNHHYHTDCIVPWLELHGTCPVCRKNLEGEDTTSGPAAGDPGIPDTDFLSHDSGSGSSARDSSTSATTSSSTSQSPSNRRQAPRGSSNHFDPIDDYD